MGAPDFRDRTVRSAALLFRELGVDGTGLRDVVEHARRPRPRRRSGIPPCRLDAAAEIDLLLAGPTT